VIFACAFRSFRQHRAEGNAPANLNQNTDPPSPPSSPSRFVPSSLPRNPRGHSSCFSSCDLRVLERRSAIFSGGQSPLDTAAPRGPPGARLLLGRDDAGECLAWRTALYPHGSWLRVRRSSGGTRRRGQMSAKSVTLIHLLASIPHPSGLRSCSRAASTAPHNPRNWRPSSRFSVPEKSDKRLHEMPS